MVSLHNVICSCNCNIYCREHLKRHLNFPTYCLKFLFQLHVYPFVCFRSGLQIIYRKTKMTEKKRRLPLHTSSQKYRKIIWMYLETFALTPRAEERAAPVRGSRHSWTLFRTRQGSLSPRFPESRQTCGFSHCRKKKKSLLLNVTLVPWAEDL